MTAPRATVLVVARAPVPGEAKTRLIPALGVDGAAEVAAAALIDTLHAVADAAPALGGPGSTGSRPVVALTGDLARAARAGELRELLEECIVIPQRGTTFAERLTHAHQDAAAIAGPATLQIGMDTPQVTRDLLVRSAAGLAVADAVIGPAEDGGWWLLAVRAARFTAGLAQVPMSTAHTGRDTRAALTAVGARVGEAPGLRDVDDIDDALAVARLVPGSRFATALRTARVGALA